MKNTLRIENGMVYGFASDLGFESSSPAGSKRQVSATWNFDGMTTEDFCALAWANFKVVVQRTTLKAMKDSDIASLRGKTLDAKDYLKAQSGGLAAKIAEQSAKLLEIQKGFIKLAMDEAIRELGPDQSNDAYSNRGMALYREKYEALVS